MKKITKKVAGRKAAKPLKQFTRLAIIVDGVRGAGKTGLIETVIKPALAAAGIGVGGPVEDTRGYSGHHAEIVNVVVPAGHFKAWAASQPKIPLKPAAGVERSCGDEQANGKC